MSSLICVPHTAGRDTNLEMTMTTTHHKCTEKLHGHDGLRQITTPAGNVWVVSACGKKAWPLLGYATAFGPYDIDVARAVGQEVNADLPPESYAVTNAGPDWRAVYELLRAS